MSSDIQTTLELLVLNNYLSLTSVVVVVYDYIITVSKEIENIWLRPWSWVSTMFIVVRYIGLYWIMTNALKGSSFVPGPLEVSTVIYLISGWALVLFISATDLIMILRVYAMWNRSRTILSILLSIFVAQTIVAVVLDGIYNNPNTHVLVTLTQVSDFSFCNISYINTPAAVQVYRAAPRLVLSAALVILAVSQTLKESFEMYKATKQWQPNRYMQKLVGDGILYFIVNVVCQIYYVVIPVEAPTKDVAVFLGIFLDLAFYNLIPRFIIGIRELYDRDICGGFHIDTGFGVVSQSNAGPDTSVSSGTSNSSDLEMGRVHGSELNEDSPITRE